MVDKSKIFSGAMADWEPLAPPPAGRDSAGSIPVEADHVAREFTIVSKKYGRNAAAATQDSASSSEHASLLRAKKKGSLDNDVNAKTFVVSGDKIIGSQG